MSDHGRPIDERIAAVIGSGAAYPTTKPHSYETNGAFRNCVGGRLLVQLLLHDLVRGTRSQRTPQPVGTGHSHG